MHSDEPAQEHILVDMFKTAKIKYVQIEQPNGNSKFIINCGAQKIVFYFGNVYAGLSKINIE